MTKKEMIKKLQIIEATHWNDYKAWKNLCTDEEAQTCDVYRKRLHDWSKVDDILKALDIKADYDLHI